MEQVLGIAAVVLFSAEAVLRKSLVAAGLACWSVTVFVL